MRRVPRIFPQRGTAALAGLALALAVAPTVAHSAFVVRGNVIANGGDAGAGAQYQIVGSAGQAAVGVGARLYKMVCSGFWCFGGARVVSVGDSLGDGPPGVLLPTELAFGSPMPNPSRGDVRFTLALPSEATITFAVYDVAGRQLGEPVSRHFEAGWHQIAWSAPASHSGVYFGRLNVEGRLRAERRIVLVR